MIAFDREGDPVFAAGDRSIRPLDPAGGLAIANGTADLRSSDRTLQVILPLRNKFERVGDLMLAMDRGKVTEKVQTAFLPIIILAGIASTFFSIVVFASWRAPETRQKRRAAITFAATFLVVAAAIVLTMVSVFSDGAQSKGRALADSLGQRLDDIANYKLQLDQIDGLGAMLERVSPPQHRRHRRQHRRQRPHRRAHRSLHRSAASGPPIRRPTSTASTSRRPITRATSRWSWPCPEASSTGRWRAA